MIKDGNPFLGHEMDCRLQEKLFNFLCIIATMSKRLQDQKTMIID